MSESIPPAPPLASTPPPVRYRSFAEKADRLARWAAVALGFSIPVSVALDGVLLASLGVFWVLGGGFRKKFELVRKNSVAVLFLAMFGLLLVGTLYGAGSAGDRLKFLAKYDDMLFIVLFLPLLQERGVRRNALLGFAAAMLLMLALSYLTAWGVMPQNRLFHGTPDNPVVFKLHITHNLLMAFAAFLFATAARHETASRKRLLLAMLAALAVYNVLFMVQGRTGQVVLAVLLVYFLFDWLRWKGLVAAFLAGAVLVGAAFYGSKSFRERISQASAEFSQWQPERASDTSVGLRLEFYKNSLAIIRDHPIFGVGTGGFAATYAEKVKGTGMVATVNPHNEYLLIAVQLGVVGLALLLYVFYRQWRLAAELPGPFERSLAHGLLLTIMVGCLFNSLLIDHTERLFYVWMSALLYAGLNPPFTKEETRPSPLA